MKIRNSYIESSCGFWSFFCSVNNIKLLHIVPFHAGKMGYPWLQRCGCWGELDLTWGGKIIALYLVASCSLLKTGRQIVFTPADRMHKTLSSIINFFKEITLFLSQAVYVYFPSAISRIICTNPPIITPSMISGEINFQHMRHLLFTLFPVINERSFENL